MIHPIESFILAQAFGVPGQFYTDQGLLGHNGIDLAVPNGTSVRCTNPKESFVHKIVEETVGSTGTRGKGMWCVEKEPDSQGRYLVTIYWHLQDFLFQENDTVKEGDIIALSNNTGQSSGPHLHFGVKYYAKNSTGDFYTLNINNGYGGFIDPMPFFVMLPTPVTRPAPTEPEQYLELSNGVELRLENQQTLHTLIAGGQLPGSADPAYIVKKGVLIIIPES